jgi:hypothetical protein
MPIYNFFNKETNEIIERTMSIKAMEEFLKDNPQYSIHHGSPPGLGDTIRMGLKKPDEGFRDILRNIKSKHYGSKVNTF